MNLPKQKQREGRGATSTSQNVVKNVQHLLTKQNTPKQRKKYTYYRRITLSSRQLRPRQLLFYWHVLYQPIKVKNGPNNAHTSCVVDILHRCVSIQ